MISKNGRISLLLALVAFIVIVTGLGANVATLRGQNLSLSVAETTSFIPNATQPIQLGNGAPEPLPSISSSGWYLVAVIVILGVAVGYAYFKQRQPPDYSPSTIAQLLALLIILAFFFLIYEASILGIGAYLSSLQGAGVYLLIYALIACSAFGLLLLFWRVDVFSPFRRRVGTPGGLSPVTTPLDNGGKEGLEELKSILDDAASLLYRGGDYRETVIRCYKTVLSLLEHNGMPRRPSLTPREFEKELSRRLGVSASGQLRALTFLFERARYSDKPASPEDAETAEETLKRMSSELSSYSRTTVEDEDGASGADQKTLGM